jgi:two-component system OmpR family response regulator
MSQANALESVHHERAGRILVVDDEDNITFLLESALRHFGFGVRVASTGREALREVENFAPDVILLDVMLPDLDGFEVIRRLRLDGMKVPVLFLTARDAVDDKVRGLTLGGDDYVTKPFSLEEVVARIEVILRRQGVASGSSKLALADLEMDDDAHIVRRAGQTIELSPTEYNLLRFLLINSGRVLSRNQILDHVWQYDFGGHATVVETYISYLRKKVDQIGPPLIHTVRGVGYSLRVA